MVRLPVEYQEVEYIESTGTQYIVTDIEGRFSMTFESDIEFTGNQDSYSVGFLDGNFRIGGNGYYGSKTQISYGSTYRLGTYIKFNTKYNYKTILEQDIQKVFIDGELTSTYDMAKNVTALTGKHVGIFARLNNDNYASLFSKAKMHNLKISDENELLGNFIPCYHKSSGEIGMYDTVSKQFYTNSGTGTFLKGNDVTYDNINLLESRRRILLNTPHIETVSDTIASFKTDVPANIKGCKIHFTPIQEGEGDPSPDNVRPISGWDGVTLYLSGSDTSNPTTLTIPFNRTIYGGYVDLIKGEVVEEYDIAATFSQYRQNNGFIAYRTAIISDQNKEFYCNMIGTYGNFSTANMTRNIIQKIRAGSYLCLALDENADVNDLRIAYPLITPNTYPIDSQTLKALRGMNNIWSDANGNIEVSFYTH